jgi:hypothetical protein
MIINKYIGALLALAMPLALANLFSPILMSAKLYSPHSGTALGVMDGNRQLEHQPAGEGPIQSTASHSINGGTLSKSLFAQADYGVLSVNSFSSMTDTSSPVRPIAWAYASFEDVITIGFAPFTGSPGLLAVDFTLSGITEKSGSFNAGVGVLAMVCSNRGKGGMTCEDDLGSSQVSVFTSSFSGVFSFPEFFQFTWGHPFNLEFRMRAVTGSFDGPYSILLPPYNSERFKDIAFTPNQTTLSGSGSADFRNLVLSGLHVFDSQGNPVHDVTFASSSGTEYTQNGVVLNGSVPEPSTWVLLLMGSAVLAVIGHKSAKPTERESLVAGLSPGTSATSANRFGASSGDLQ